MLRAHLSSSQCCAPLYGGAREPLHEQLRRCRHAAQHHHLRQPQDDTINASSPARVAHNLTPRFWSAQPSADNMRQIAPAAGHRAPGHPPREDLFSSRLPAGRAAAGCGKLSAGAPPAPTPSPGCCPWRCPWHPAAGPPAEVAWAPFQEGHITLKQQCSRDTAMGCNALELQLNHSSYTTSSTTTLRGGTSACLVSEACKGAPRVALHTLCLSRKPQHNTLSRLRSAKQNYERCNGVKWGHATRYDASLEKANKGHNAAVRSVCSVCSRAAARR